MVNSRVNVTFNPKTSQHLIELAKATKQSVQKLTEKLIKEAIELEAEDIAFSKIVRELDADDSEEVEDSEDIWK
ncbi:hypothetical protein WD_0268 [Wolbachia endosymbiont of Drosophila melanogaster]|uniref:hypothetical protein n=1 Tax=Wolbachia TaxID=953 RepID=UPI000023B952|nr:MULTISPECIES: hypothetical protein [Wolbachia]MDE5063979.1 hypothetical protein [Wolbachia endosymbiont of Drosophila chauvacae]QHJ75440.1 RelB/StbD replicon stabilization protein [Wolbachia phage WO]CDR79037.1 hypothetical protein WPAU_0658 [Wolbachia endosymbiont of Drosophila simulans wAu]AAS14008.1 hypothetical protein WD_0268 [Wolbachia endosymbiont of Drosophila melanogaster]AGJ99720.1 hypothetical protein wHa_02430 [Wolbachia endosymbiont of Drosophila simulans wHa]